MLDISIDQDKNLFKIEGEVPKKITGATIDVDLFYNGKLIKNYQTKPYSDKIIDKKKIGRRGISTVAYQSKC